MNPSVSRWKAVDNRLKIFIIKQIRFHINETNCGPLFDTTAIGGSWC
jgi:hypothetical protein